MSPLYVGQQLNKLTEENTRLLMFTFIKSVLGDFCIAKNIYKRSKTQNGDYCS